MQSINPYRPSEWPQHDADEDTVTFSGQVDATDVSNLLQASARNVMLVVLGLSAIAPMLTLPSTRSFAGVAVLTVFAAMITVVAMVINKRSPIDGLLQRNPNLVGSINGRLSAEGCFIRHGEGFETHLLTWSACKRVDVNRYGIRICWGFDRVIVLPFHCFGAFEDARMRKRIRQFRAIDFSDPIYRVLIDWSTVSKDAVRFEIPTQIDAKRNQGDIELQWYQWGFFDHEALTVLIVDHKRVKAWEEIRQVKIEDQAVKVLFHNHDLFTIPRTNFLKGDWEKLADWRSNVSPYLNVAVLGDRVLES